MLKKTTYFICSSNQIDHFSLTLGPPFAFPGAFPGPMGGHHPAAAAVAMFRGGVPGGQGGAGGRGSGGQGNGPSGWHWGAWGGDGGAWPGQHGGRGGGGPAGGGPMTPWMGAAAAAAGAAAAAAAITPTERPGSRRTRAVDDGTAACALPVDPNPNAAEAGCAVTDESCPLV